MGLDIRARSFRRRPKPTSIVTAAIASTFREVCRNGASLPWSDQGCFSPGSRAGSHAASADPATNQRTSACLQTGDFIQVLVFSRVRTANHFHFCSTYSGTNLDRNSSKCGSEPPLSGNQQARQKIQEDAPTGRTFCWLQNVGFKIQSNNRNWMGPGKEWLWATDQGPMTRSENGPESPLTDTQHPLPGRSDGAHPSRSRDFQDQHGNYWGRSMAN